MMNKEMVDVAFETTLEQGLLMERRMFQVLTATEDKTEGMAAFVEKRLARLAGGGWGVGQGRFPPPAPPAGMKIAKIHRSGQHGRRHGREPRQGRPHG